MVAYWYGLPFCVNSVLRYLRFQSYDFLCALAEVRDLVPISYVLVYGIGNIVLQGLNWFWFVYFLGNSRSSSCPEDRFCKMVLALRKRFFVNASEQGKLVDKPDDNVDANGYDIKYYNTNS
jgi:hypothetical protein